MIEQLFPWIFDAVQVEEFLLKHFYFWTVLIMCNCSNKVMSINW